MENINLITDKSVQAKIRKVARDINVQADKIVSVCIKTSHESPIFFKLNNNLSDGNKDFLSIFESIRNIINQHKRITMEAGIELEGHLRKIMHMSGFILTEFNYSEDPLRRVKNVRRKFKRRAKYMYKYSCDDMIIMQTMRDVRNLFKMIDA